MFIGHEQRGDKDGQFIDEVFFEQRRAETGAGFDQHGGDVVLGAQVLHVVCEVEAVSCFASSVNMYAAQAKRRDAVRWRGGQAQYDDGCGGGGANER